LASPISQVTKCPQKGCGQGPGANFLKFKTPFRKTGMGEARNVKFGIQIDFGKSHIKHDKIHPKGA